MVGEYKICEIKYVMFMSHELEHFKLFWTKSLHFKERKRSSPRVRRAYADAAPTISSSHQLFRP
jgi:hypothetical protein